MDTALPVGDPTQPPANPCAPVLRDDLPLPAEADRSMTALDFAEGAGEPPD
jgi:hypothetical protein